MWSEGSEQFWIASDVAAALNIKGWDKQVSRYEDYEKGVGQYPTPGGTQSFIILKEPGVYRMILNSRKKEASDFKKWLFCEVLPQIRRTGSYSFGSSQEGITSFDQIGGNLDQVIHALKSLKAYSETLAVTIQKQRETIKEQKAAIDKAAGIGSSLMTSKRVSAPKLEDPDQSVMEFMQLEGFGRRLMEKLAGAS